MCNDWKIDGKYCMTGAELVAAIGSDAARRVNTLYKSVGETFWRPGPNGERNEYICTDATVEESCLCHVEPKLMAEVLGGTWDYSPDEDVFLRAA